MDKEKYIRDSWEANAGNWIQLLNGEGIVSRKLATNQAIVDTILADQPETVLDIGCGEGWLCRALQEKGIQATGTDFSEELIQAAGAAGAGEYYVASFEDFAEGLIAFPHAFDCIAINFALIGKESVDHLIPALPRWINPGGKLCIQTLHSETRKASGDYVSGWKTGSWDGLAGEFVMPYDWYFRTLEDWQQLISGSGFSQVETKSVLHPQTGLPLSVIFTGRI